MNILVVGGGGREHALVWKIAQSPLVERVHCAPGNPGIARLAACHDIGVNDFDRLVALAREKSVGLVVVGIGLLLHLAGVPWALVIAGAAAFIAAALNATVGFCLGCELYLLLSRAGVIRSRRAA